MAAVRHPVMHSHMVRMMVMASVRESVVERVSFAVLLYFAVFCNCQNV